MRVTVEKPREGVVLAERFLAENPGLEAVEAELRRLRGLQAEQRRPENHGLKSWLETRDGADYRLTISQAETRLRGEASRRAAAAKRRADEAALEAEAQAEASLTLEDRLSRVEAALRFRGWKL